MADFDSVGYESTAVADGAFEAARESLQRLDFRTALTQLQTSLQEASDTGDHVLQERATSALALCRSLITMEQAAREIEEAHRHAMEIHEAERNDIASALTSLLDGGISVPVQTAPGLGLGLALGTSFILPFALGVVEVQRPASMDPPPAPTPAPAPTKPAAKAAPAPSKTARRLRIRMLGRFEVEVEGVVVESWRSKRARQLCAYLALNRREDLSRHRLMGVFWPEHPEERAENNLSLTVMALRRLLDGERSGNQTLVPFRASAYALDAANLWLDTDAFEEAAGAAARLEAASDFAGSAASLDEAIELYAGDLLPADVYEDWTVDLRQHLQDLYTDVLQRRAGLARRANDYDTSIELNRRMLSRDPAYEAAHRQLMLDYLATGQRSRAVAQMTLCREALMRHLGVEPEPATQAVFAKVTAK